MNNINKLFISNNLLEPKEEYINLITDIINYYYNKIKYKNILYFYLYDNDL